MFSVSLKNSGLTGSVAHIQAHGVLSVCVCVCLTDVFKLDPDFLENEEKYKTIKRGEDEPKDNACCEILCLYCLTCFIIRHLLTEILDEGSSDSGGDDDGSDDDEDDEDAKEEDGEGKAGEKSN